MEDIIVDTITIPEAIDRHTDKSGLIFEAKTIYNPIPGVRHYTYRIDKQLGDGGPGRQRHIHVFHNGEQVFAMNADSTAHDGSHQVKIPDDVSSFLSQKGFSLPPNNIIECYCLPKEQSLLLEELHSGILYQPDQILLFISRIVSDITIIVANVPTYQVRMHTSVVERFLNVQRLDIIPHERFHEIKLFLSDYLQKTNRFRDEKIEIFDGSYSPIKLYVAWNCQ